MPDKRLIYIDATTGGRGDLWMRFIGAYAFAGLKPDVEIHLLIPDFILKLAEQIFGDRLVFHTSDEEKKFNLSYSTLGIRHLTKELMKGKRFISPFQRINIKDKKKKQLKDYVNLFIFNILDSLNLVSVPPYRWSRTYHGFMELVAIRQLRGVSYDEFNAQVRKDYPLTESRLNMDIPVSPELVIPADIKDKILIFPSGTSKQFMPPDWAAIHYPDAYYAIFHLEWEVDRFTKHGLKVVPYYVEPGDIVALSREAKWTICTDSFPSHLIQSTHARASTLITEVEKSRVINPGFKGIVVDSVVTCHPCVRTGRMLPCTSGFMECANWKSSIYAENIMRSISDDFNSIK
jgi:hypothetical protein